MRGIFIAILILLMGAPAEAQFRRQRNAEPESDEMSGEYSAVVENNIFLRNRGRRPAPPPPTSRPVTPPLTREQTLILTGIVLEEGEFRAYFEDTRGNSIVRVAEGEAIASGTIAQIMIDAVAYETPDGFRWIDIGHDLTASLPNARAGGTSSTGSSGGSAATAGGTPASTSGSGSDTPATSDPALMSVEERLRQRRLRTLGN